MLAWLHHQRGSPVKPLNRHQAKRAWKTFELCIRPMRARANDPLCFAKEPVTKPHGRRAWEIHVWGSYFDFGVMPRLVAPASLT